jgi:hypothetical protein
VICAHFFPRATHAETRGIALQHSAIAATILPSGIASPQVANRFHGTAVR